MTVRPTRKAGQIGPAVRFKAERREFRRAAARQLTKTSRDLKDGHQGDFLYVPAGGVHGFRNGADEPASILMLFAPGAPREAYFDGFGALADMTDDERREWFIHHDNFFV